MKKGIIIVLLCIFSISFISSQEIKIVAPKEGQVLTAGTTFKIKWYTKGYLTNTVKIKLFNALGTRLVAIIYSDAPTKDDRLLFFKGGIYDGAGSFSWNIPLSLGLSKGEHVKKAPKKYIIMIKTKDNSTAAFSKPFLIKKKPPLNLK